MLIIVKGVRPVGYSMLLDNRTMLV